jgi:hypothetical protein
MDYLYGSNNSSRKELNYSNTSTTNCCDSMEIEFFFLSKERDTVAPPRK